MLGYQRTSTIRSSTKWKPWANRRTQNYDSSLHNLNFIELAPATCEMFPKLYLNSLCIH